MTFGYPTSSRALPAKSAAGRGIRPTMARAQTQPSPVPFNCQRAEHNNPRSRDAIAPEVWTNTLVKTEGAGNAGRPMRPIAARAMVAIERTRVSQVTPESPGIPRAMVLTVSFALSLVTGLSCHHRPRSLPANLTPASGRQDHTTSPSATSVARLAPPPRPPHPAPNVRDDRDTPLL